MIFRKEKKNLVLNLYTFKTNVIPLFKKYSSEKEKLLETDERRNLGLFIREHTKKIVHLFENKNGRRDLVNYCLSCDRLPNDRL